MPEGLFLTAVLFVAVQMQRQSGNGLRQYPDTGVHGGHLHGRAFRYGFSGSTVAQEEPVTAAIRAVAGLVTRVKEAAEDAHEGSPSFQINKMPLSSYTEAVETLPHRMARSSPIIAAIAPSIFSVDFSLSALMFPAGSVRM